MKGNELVWRTLADEALQGNRRWHSVGDLADAAGVPMRTAYLAVDKLISNGSVERRPRGISTTNPEKILNTLGAWRNLDRDTVMKTTVAGITAYLDQNHTRYALGGADAAVHHLGGTNTVADIGARIVYVPEDTALPQLPEGDEVTVLTMDKRARRDWRDGFSSFAQTYADLFASPGWQAEEFRRALWSARLSAADWDQKPVLA